jgi:hypothetical protein
VTSEYERSCTRQLGGRGVAVAIALVDSVVPDVLDVVESLTDSEGELLAADEVVLVLALEAVVVGPESHDAPIAPSSAVPAIKATEARISPRLQPSLAIAVVMIGLSSGNQVGPIQTRTS